MFRGVVVRVGDSFVDLLGDKRGDLRGDDVVVDEVEEDIIIFYFINRYYDNLC